MKCDDMHGHKNPEFYHRLYFTADVKRLSDYDDSYSNYIHGGTESTQRVQTSAEDFHVLFLTVCSNHNSK